MPRYMKAKAVREMAWLNFPAFLRQRAHTKMLDSWANPTIPTDARDVSVFRPRNQELDPEFDNLALLSPNPWGSLVISSTVQTMSVDGFQRKGAKPNTTLEVTDVWQQNGWDARQEGLYRAAVGHGLAYAAAWRGISPLTGEKSVVLKRYSGMKCAAFYDDVEDEWPRIVILADRIPAALGETGWTVQVVDEVATYYLSCKGNGESIDDWTFISYEAHDTGVCPFVQYAPHIDLDGRAVGEIEPIVPILGRLDQDTFDRLIVARFGAWKVRYASGLAKPETQAEADVQALRLSIQDILISDSTETKFGTLDATQITGFIENNDVDLRYLSAITQTPPHHLLGLSSNLQAEALTAAKEGLHHKTRLMRTSFGESHEQLMRLAAYLLGNQEEARAFDLQTRWADLESRSLSQAADALGKVATQLQVPVQMLWERLPNWTETDTIRALDLIESNKIDGIFEMLKQQNEQQGQQDNGQTDNSGTDTGS